MATVKATQSTRRYVPTGFHFVVIFDEGDKSRLGISGSTPDIGFQEVSGLNASIETESYKEGGENRFSHRFPNPATYSNLVLKRGMLIGSKLIQWFKDAIENFKFTPINLRVELHDENHHVLEAWTFNNAYPVKWNIDAFNAQDGKLVAETIELSYQYFTREVVHKDLMEDKGPGN
jgi:phage tail-like protein